MFSKSFIPAAIASLVIGLTASANAAVFTFEFEADGSLPSGNVFGTVTGRIVGVSEGDAVADAVIIDTLPDALLPFFTPGQNILKNPNGNIFNEFIVAGNAITNATFMYSRVGQELCFNAAAISSPADCGSNQNVISNREPNGTIAGNNRGFDGVTFAPVAEVPLPAAAPLFAAGLGLIALIRRRQRMAKIQGRS